MKDRKQRRTLSGAVLVMVLTVMFVLIILLMATLTVVTTANQRIYTKFEENQAYYTARSALDVFTQDMLSDGDYYAYGSSGIRTYKYTYEDVTSSPVVLKTSAATNMTQGLALQQELYKITSQSEIYGGVLGFAENPKESDHIFYANVDGTNKDMEENKFYTIETTNALNSDPDNTKNFDYIEYQVTLPAVRTSATDSYGRIVDTDSSGKQIAKIKVEVLSRVFNTNPSYTPAEIQTIVSGSNSTAKQALKNAIRDGDRTKDQIRVKITSTVEFAHTVGTAVLIYDTRCTINNFQRALTMFGQNNSMDSINIVGDVAVGDPSSWQNNCDIFGNFYCENSWNLSNNGPTMHITSGECVYIGDDFKTVNNGFTILGYGIAPVPKTTPPTPVDKDSRPVIYVQGEYNPTNNVTFGGTPPNATQETSGEEVDFIVGSIKPTGNASFIHNGDVYCIGDFDCAGIGGSKKVTVYGDLYIGGNCDLSNMNPNPGDFTVTGDVYINGNLTTGGGITYSSLNNSITNKSGIAGNIHFGSASQVNGNSIEASPTMTANGYDKQPITFDFAKKVGTNYELDLTKDKDSNTEIFDIELPNGVSKKIPTHASSYNDYYMKDKNGQLIISGGNPVAITAEQKAFTDAADMANGVYSNKTFSDSSFSGIITPAASVISAASNPATPLTNGAYKMDPSLLNSKKIYIGGGGTVDILLSASTSYQNIDIITDNNTTVNFYGSGNFTFEKLNVYNADTSKAVDTSLPVATRTLNVGNKKGFGIQAPKINYYFSTGTVSFRNGAFITGYVYAPSADMEFWGVNAVKIPMNYNGNAVKDTSNNDIGVNFVGAVLCHDLQFQNKSGMAYINPELKSNPGNGKPPLEWKTYQYKRD